MIAITTRRMGGRGLNIPFVGFVTLMRLPETEELLYSSIGCTVRRENAGIAKILYDQNVDQDLGSLL